MHARMASNDVHPISKSNQLPLEVSLIERKAVIALIQWGGNGAINWAQRTHEREGEEGFKKRN